MTDKITHRSAFWMDLYFRTTSNEIPQEVNTTAMWGQGVREIMRSKKHAT